MKMCWRCGKKVEVDDVHKISQGAAWIVRKRDAYLVDLYEKAGVSLVYV